MLSLSQSHVVAEHPDGVSDCLRQCNVCQTGPDGAVDTVSRGAVSVNTEKLEMLRSLTEWSGPGHSAGEKDMFFDHLLSYADMLSSSTSVVGRTDKK